MLCCAVFAALLSGCAHAPKEITLTKADSGRILDVTTGDLLTLSLQTNPTTGFSWKLLPVDEQVLIPCGASQLRMLQQNKKNKPAVCGAPSEEIWTFKVVGPGTCGLKLEYRRPWEKNVPPAEQFSILLKATGRPPEFPLFNPNTDNEKGPETMTDSKGRVHIKSKKLLR